MSEYFTKFNLAIYLIISVIFISVLFYQFLYNKIIIGSINNDMKRLDIPNNKERNVLFYYDFNNKDIDKQNKTNNNLNLIFIAFAIVFCLFYSLDMYDNIKINFDKLAKITLKIGIWIIVMGIPGVIIGLKFLEKSNIDDKDNKEIKLDDILKSNKSDGISNGILLVLVVMTCYFVFRSIIKNGVINVSISNYNNFILYEKIFILFFITLFYSSIIVAVNKKITITQNIIDNKANINNRSLDLNGRITLISDYGWNEKYNNYFNDITNDNNNYVLNIIFGILSIILVLYFYFNHIKSNKFDLINSYKIRESLSKRFIFSFFDPSLVVLLGLFIIIPITSKQ